MTVTPTGFTVSWEAPAAGGALTYGYTLVQRVTGSGAFQIIATGLTGTSYAFSDLVPTTSYDTGVFGVNGAGPGPMSVVTQATLGEVPNAPTGLTVRAGTPVYSDALLSWTAPGTDSTNGPASSYIVQQSPHGADTWTTIGTPTATSFTVAGLLPDTAYDFQVFGVNSEGASATPSGTATITTDYAPPNAPTISSVAPVNDGTTTKLTVTWTAPATDSTHSAATGYNLQYSVHGAGSWTQVTGVTSPYTITGLSTGTSYDVEVQGTNASTTSPGAWSSIATASTYSCALTWGVSGQPQSTAAPGIGNNINGVDNEGMNIDASPTPVDVYVTAVTQNATVPSSGLTSVTDAGSPYYWAVFYPVPTTAGTYYFWAIATDSSGDVIGAMVSGTIAVS